MFKTEIDRARPLTNDEMPKQETGGWTSLLIGSIPAIAAGVVLGATFGAAATIASTISSTNVGADFDVGCGEEMALGGGAMHREIYDDELHAAYGGGEEADTDFGANKFGETFKRRASDCKEYLMRKLSRSSSTTAVRKASSEPTLAKRRDSTTSKDSTDSTKSTGKGTMEKLRGLFSFKRSKSESDLSTKKKITKIEIGEPENFSRSNNFLMQELTLKPTTQKPVEFPHQHIRHMDSVIEDDPPQLTKKGELPRGRLCSDGDSEGEDDVFYPTDATAPRRVAYRGSGASTGGQQIVRKRFSSVYARAKDGSSLYAPSCEMDVFATPPAKPNRTPPTVQGKESTKL